MSEFVDPNKEAIDIIVFVADGGMELPMEIGPKEPTPELKGWLTMKSYNNKRKIQINTDRCSFVDRLPEVEYLANVEESRRQRMLQQMGGRGLAVPTMMIPKKLN